MNYILYCRKSTDSEDRQVLSLDSQEKELKALAEKHDLNIIKTVKESGSAKELGRPLFNEVIEMIKSGDANALLCWKMDRLARNFIDGGKIIDLLQKEKIKEIRTHTDVHKPSDNVLPIAMHFGMANQYSRDLSENVKRGNRAKLEKGGWPGRAPIGYENNKADNTIVIDPERAPYIKKLFRLYATGGYSLKDLTKKMYEEGFRSRKGNKVHKSTIHRILNNSFYCGIMERNGKTYQGRYESIISVDTYKKVERLIERGKSRPKRKNHFYSARGFLVCDKCGCNLTAVTKKGYTYYYCTNGKGICDQHKNYMRREKINDLISNLLQGNLMYNQEFINMFADAYKEKYNQQKETIESKLEPYENKLESLIEKESKLADMLTDNKIREAVYDRKLDDINKKREEIKAKIKQIKKKGVQPKATFEQVREFFFDTNGLAKAYPKLEKHHQKRILEKVLLNASVKNEKVASYRFKPLYQRVATTPQNPDFETMQG